MGGLGDSGITIGWGSRKGAEIGVSIKVNMDLSMGYGIIMKPGMVSSTGMRMGNRADINTWAVIGARARAPA